MRDEGLMKLGGEKTAEKNELVSLKTKAKEE